MFCNACACTYRSFCLFNRLSLLGWSLAQCLTWVIGSFLRACRLGTHGMMLACWRFGTIYGPIQKLRFQLPGNNVCNNLMLSSEALLAASELLVWQKVQAGECALCEVSKMKLCWWKRTLWLQTPCAKRARKHAKPARKHAKRARKKMCTTSMIEPAWFCCFVFEGFLLKDNVQWFLKCRCGAP